jgi:hypothetical protein
VAVAELGKLKASLAHLKAKFSALNDERM